MKITQLPVVADLLALHSANPTRYPFLLASVSGDDEKHRYDILFACPQAELRLHANKEGLGLEASALVQGAVLPELSSHDFLTQLNAWFEQTETGAAKCDLPFSGGWFLFLAYELAAQIEPILTMPMSEDAPVAIATRIPGAIIIERGKTQRCFVVTETGFENEHGVLLDDCKNLRPQTPAESFCCDELREDPPEQFTRAVETALTYIQDGDVYQANLSREWRANVISGQANDLFTQLCRSNPAPFAALAHYADMQIVSSSPERLVDVRGSRVTTRPIAGTRPRSDSQISDGELSGELLAHPKEQAEHVMLIDLERNDLGRICEAGSVHVDEMMALESYAHVHHIVSNVTGTLRADVLPADVIRAVFPGGTITGCPKVRCMQIIAELEQCPRRAYTGSLGYLNLDGSMDLNILIRTIELANGKLSFRAGAGIVADSQPLSELKETRDKAKGMIMALQEKSCVG